MFITLTDMDNNTLLINTNHIMKIVSKERFSIITLSTDVTFNVKETQQQIILKIRGDVLNG